MTATGQLLPLFYPAGVQQLELIQLVLGALDPETLGRDVGLFEAEGNCSFRLGDGFNVARI